MLTEAILDQEEAIWKSGYRAYEAGIPKAPAPFVKGSRAHKAWTQGWECGRHEHNDDPPED
jgi:hypothetical protein